MQMPKITQCEVSECAYNRNMMCHALAITIGGGDDHMCDTFYESEMQGGDPKSTGCVGACRSVSCTHNENLECCASEIKVGHKQMEIDCMTFKEKS